MASSLVQPYADRHINLNGPGDSRPTAEEIIRDQKLVNGLQDFVVLITGCTSGIGVETARALYLTGARIYITSRDLSKGQLVAKELSTDVDRPVKVLEMSLDSFDSVRQAAVGFLQVEKKLNILINNAGVMACPQTQTKDGHELQFGTNHLGHFLLFQLLKPALLAAATPQHPSRVVAVSSSAHGLAPGLPLDDLDFSRSEYNPWVAYGRSKLANLYFASELSRRYGPQHLHALSLHPGSISTPLQRHVIDQDIYKDAVKNEDYLRQTKSVEQGAATTVWAAVGVEWMHRGAYLDDVGEAGPAENEGPMWRGGYFPTAINPKIETELWEVSNGLCGTEG